MGLPGMGGESVTVVLAGGSGGLGSATARLLAEDFPLVISYKSNRARAEKLSDIGLIVQADLGSVNDRRVLLDAASDLYGVVVFSGDPARGPEFESASRRSFESNYLGPAMLAREAADRMKLAGTAGAIILICDDASGVAVHRVDGIRCAKGGADSCGPGAREGMPGKDKYSSEHDLPGCESGRHGRSQYRFGQIRQVYRWGCHPSLWSGGRRGARGAIFSTTR